MRRRTPTIPYAPLAPRPADSGTGKRPAALRGLRAKPVVAEPVETPRPKDPAKARLNAGLGFTPPPQSARYENLTASVEFTSQKDILDAAYDLEDQLAPHLAWLTDDQERDELFKQLAKGDHGRTLSIMMEARRRYPRNISIGRSIQIVERAAIARLLARIGPLEHVPERLGQHTLGRDPVSIFSLVDGHATFEDILRGSPFPRLRTLEILAELVRRNAVRVRDELLPRSMPQAVRSALTAQEIGARQHASMRPRLETQIPFVGRDDDTGRATIPDPLEVAARAALLRDPGDLPSARSPSMRARAITPEATKAQRELRERHSAGGFRPSAKDVVEQKTAPKVTALDNRMEREEKEIDRAARTRRTPPPRIEISEPPPPTARRGAQVSAAELMAEVEREVQAVAASKRAQALAKAAASPVEPTAEAEGTLRSHAEGTLRSHEAITRQDLRANGVFEHADAEQGPVSGPRTELASAPESVPARSTLESAVPPIASSAPPPVSLSAIVETPMFEGANEPRLRFSIDELDTSRGEAPPGSQRRRSAVLWLAGAAVVLSAVAVVIALTRSNQIAAPQAVLSAATAVSSVSQPSAVQSGQAAQPIIPPVATYRLSVEVTPREARVYLDDTLLTGHPIQQTLPRDQRPHLLRVEAAGYKTRTTPLDGSSDTKLIISLELMPPVTPKRPLAPIAGPSARTDDIYH